MLSPQNIRSINLDTTNVPKNKKTKKKRINYTLSDLENYTSKLDNFNKDDIQKVLAKHQIKFTKFSKETDKFLDQIKEKVEAKKAKKTHKRVRFKEKTPEQIIIQPYEKKENEKKEYEKKENEKKEYEKRGNEKRENEKKEYEKRENEKPNYKEQVLNKVANLKLQTYNQEQSLNRIVNRNKSQIAPYTTKSQLHNLYTQLNFNILHLEKEREIFQKESNPKIINQIIQRKNQIKILLENINQLEKIHKPIPKYNDVIPIENVSRPMSPKFKAIEIIGSIKDLESMNSNGKFKQPNKIVHKSFNNQNLIKTITYNPKITQVKHRRKIVDGSLRNKFKWKQHEIKNKLIKKLIQKNKSIKPKPKYRFIESEGDIDLKNDISKQKWISRMVFLPNNDFIFPIININNKNIKEYLKNQSFESILLI
jgi:hypothetical protein